ncbi:MAG: response regulator [Deltaproteobacteria bacterium]|nr:response regulator [Deltaproteobacteria bacterium]MBW1793412.1 response regulator [Deltaproteobacteria bacterium]MBW2330819.1 response regulator [Deltaproteobacteria bacterium]
MKILVADDSALMRHVLVKILTEAGVESVVQAWDGQAAVQKVAEEAPDLVLMDWVMPKMTGIDAVKKIRASGNKVPIIMCTTEGEQNRIVDAIKAGANNFVVKPFDPKIIITKIKETLAKVSS